MWNKNNEEDQGGEINQAMIDDRIKVEKDKDAHIKEIQAVLNGAMDKEGENQLIVTLQKHRNLLLDMATQAFIKKPNSSSLLDSINTLLGTIERTIRDDRKERMKDRELEDNKANFASFVNALNEVSSGRLVLPNYGSAAMILDPMKPIIDLSDDPDNDIDEGELVMGAQIIDSDAVKAEFDDDE